MSIELLFTIIGAGLVIIGLIGGIIVRDRQVHKTIAEGDNILHARITKVQEEYVRRDDLYNHIRSIENIVNQMREEQRATNARIDAVLSSLSNQKR